MKINLSSLLIPGLAALTFACANPSETGHAHTGASGSATHADATPETHAAELGKLTQNNGEPWDANSATTEGIVLMSDLTGRFVERTDPQAYKNLQAGLNQEFKEIVAKCTMKGEAHNQLHHYLMPLKSYIDGLSSENLAEAESNFDKLKAHLEVYPEYFRTR